MRKVLLIFFIGFSILFVPAVHAFLPGGLVPAAMAVDDLEKPPPATDPSKCGTNKTVQRGSVALYMPPENCLFLEEPIGGRPSYDLYTIGPCYDEPSLKGCIYKLWGGEGISGDIRGPVQALLTGIPGKDAESGFTLLYQYVGLIYKYFSGVIVGVVILFIIVGGIQMITSAGDSNQFGEGRKRIVRAIVGMVVWFLASLILYTINPTFFAF